MMPKHSTAEASYRPTNPNATTLRLPTSQTSTTSTAIAPTSGDGALKTEQ
jgi:hypothetical protein